MKETYRKRGHVIRWENGTLVRVSESGLAIEDGELFSCHPEPFGVAQGRLREGSPAVSPDSVLETVNAITAIDARIERLIVTHGIAEHECNGRTWREETHRIHLSMVNGQLRALVDSMDDVARVASALARAEQQEREPPSHVVLAPNVSAAILSSLDDVEQVAGGIDGKGHEIVEARGEPWPNWYRPSYRIRPIRMPLNLRLRGDATAIDPKLPRAVALLAPPDGITLRVLIDDGARVYPSVVRVEHIEAVGAEVTWYPYGGGSFGAEMML